MTVTAPTVEVALVRSSPQVAPEREADLSSCYRASILIAVLLLSAAGAGLLGIYRDNDWVTSQLRGQDFVSLVFAVPLLLVSTNLARRGSIRAQLVWLGAIGYVVYSYLYIFAIAWNEMFLVYLGLLVVSTLTLIRALTLIDVTKIWASFSGTTPTRSVARFLTGFGVILGSMWGLQAIVATVTGEIPASVISSGHPTAVVFILDLGLVAPLFLIGGHLLRKGRPWGFVLGGILLIKGIAEGLALLGMALFMHMAKHPDFDVALVPLWALVALASTYLSFRFLGAINRSSSTLSVERG